MKLTSFNCTIEVSKDENGYSNNYYVDVTDKGVSISHPYVNQSPEQVMFITKLVHDFIGVALGFNARVDGFNRDNHLEQYAPQPETPTETGAESAVAQSCQLGGGEEAALVAHTEAEQERLDMENAKDDEEKLQAMLASGLKEVVEEKSLAKTIEENVIESLGLK